MIVPEDNADLLIVSDLHVGEGRGDPFADGASLENFTSDAAFFRLLIDRHNHLSERAPERRWTLVVNGDLFELMQIVSLPDKEDEPEAYRQLVAQRMKAHPNILLYGLGTEPDASAWKVRRIARGHAWFFRALAWWLAQGHRLAVVKGNHDVELHFPQVQAAVRAEIVRAAEGNCSGIHARRAVPGAGNEPPRTAA